MVASTASREVSVSLSRTGYMSLSRTAEAGEPAPSPRQGGVEQARAWRAGTVGLLAALLALTAAAAWFGARQRLLPADLDGHTLIGKSGLKEDTKPYCGLIEENVEYVGIQERKKVLNVSSPATCCTMCQGDLKCRAWTWGSLAGAGNVCSLKKLKPHQAPTKAPRAAVVSGMPFRLNTPGSLFCFVLMQPSGYEPQLLAMVHRERTSIFACDEYAVYSNKVMRVAPGVNTTAVDSDLKCVKGGEFKTALNTDIFMAVWTKVISDGRFRYHDWTVKVDPDSVFFAERLRIAVTFHQDTGDGVYLNNCKFGLHGPVEVFSRKAVLAWARGSARCMRHFQKLCSGPCLWGEDMFIDQCLSKVLKVKRINDWNLLSEPHCDSADWQSCSNGDITFHPFKTVDGYLTCLKNANYGALPTS